MTVAPQDVVFSESTIENADRDRHAIEHFVWIDVIQPWLANASATPRFSDSSERIRPLPAIFESINACPQCPAMQMREARISKDTMQVAPPLGNRPEKTRLGATRQVRQARQNCLAMKARISIDAVSESVECLAGDTANQTESARMATVPHGSDRSIRVAFALSSRPRAIARKQWSSGGVLDGSRWRP